jgi:hypothetical protein
VLLASPKASCLCGKPDRYTLSSSLSNTTVFDDRSLWFAVLAHYCQDMPCDRRPSSSAMPPVYGLGHAHRRCAPKHPMYPRWWFLAVSRRVVMELEFTMLVSEIKQSRCEGSYCSCNRYLPDTRHDRPIVHPSNSERRDLPNVSAKESSSRHMLHRCPFALRDLGVCS